MLWVINLTNDCEVKSDRYQAMPTWSYQCQRVWILLDDFFNVQVHNCTFGGPPPPPSSNLLNWSTWSSVKRPPFSMAALRTKLVAKPCKSQKVALEPFNQGTNYTLLDADCVLTAKIGKSFKVEFQLWSVWIEISSGISHSHLSISHFSVFQVNHFGIIKGTQFCRSLCQLWQLEFILCDYHIDISA